jgi:hypothetical protein
MSRLKLIQYGSFQDMGSAKHANGVVPHPPHMPDPLPDT